MAAGATTGRLLGAVQAAAFARRTGARVTQDGATGDVYVHDCPAWTAENAAVLRLLRPAAEVAVRGSAASLSGFVLVVREPGAAALRAGPRVAAALCALLAALAVGLALQRPPFTLF